MNTTDTIVAISSAVGPAPRMIVRLSGADAGGIVRAVAGSFRAEAGVQTLRLAFDLISIPATALVFLAPRSSTGEDVVELHIPGNPVLAKMLLRELIARGARQADPGEFTARAYFNGKVDLTQAEGVAATISAANESELKAARQLLAGELARRITPSIDLLAESLALVEVGIDFSEEDVSFLPTAQLLERIDRVDADLQKLLHECRRFERLTHEPSIVFVGWPNAGKSTLLNALCGRERAVVSAIAGTTRDVIWAEAPLRRGIVKIIDAAGIESTDSHADDRSPLAEIRREMRRRAELAVESADVVLLIQDAADSRPPPQVGVDADLVVLTKGDLIDESSSPRAATSSREPARPSIAVSAVTGAGMADLRDHLDSLAFGRSGADVLALNQRHLVLIGETRTALSRARFAIDESAGPEITALGLREALDHLGAVVGQVTPDDVLGRVFSAFCIGK